jgi:hypothetical protein
LRRASTSRLQAFTLVVRHIEVGGLDDPEAGEVFLVSNVVGSWPYGWNRSIV